MKYWIKLFVLGVVLQALVACGNRKTGVFRYSAEFLNTANMTLMDSMYVGAVEFSFMGGHSCWDFKSVLDYRYSILFDEKTHGETMMVQKWSDKTAFVTANSDVYHKGRERISFTYLADEKVICGMKCKKAIYREGRDTSDLYVYYCEDVKGPLTPKLVPIFGGLKGYPMEFIKVIQGRVLVTRMTGMSYGKINEEVFRVPKDYKVVDFDDYMKKNRVMNDAMEKNDK